MNTATVNKQFIDGVNNAVAKVVAARRVLPANTVENKVIPAHEDYLQNIIHWRLDQLSASRVFGSFASPSLGNSQPKQPKLTGVPGAIQTAYNAQVATITTAYNAQVNALKAQLNGITKDAEAKEKAANKLKDKATVTQLKAAVTQAKQAYKDGAKAADLQRQQNLTALANNFQNLVNQAAQSNQTLPPPVAGTGGGTTIGGITQYPVYDSNGNFIGYSTTPPPTNSANPTYPLPSSNGGGQVYDDPGIYDQGYDQSQSSGYPATTGTPAPVAAVPATSIIDDLFAFLNSILGGGAPVAQVATPAPGAATTVPQTPVYPDTGAVVGYDQSYAGVPDSSQLDVFGNRDPWGGSLAAYAGASPLMYGNRTIRRLNKMSTVPRSAIGFAQWGTIVSGIVQAAGQIGAAAATSALAPSAKKSTAAPVVIQAPAPAASGISSNTLLIGGGVAIAVLAMAMVMKNRR